MGCLSKTLNLPREILGSFKDLPSPQVFYKEDYSENSREMSSLQNLKAVNISISNFFRYLKLSF